MGLYLSDIKAKWFGPNIPRCLMLGLKGAGKLQILLKLKLGMYYPSIPEIDFDMHYYTICAFHIGDEYNDNPIWRRYYNNTQLLIFVVDSADMSNIDEACTELHKILEEEKLKDAALLVFANNKQDLPNALTANELRDRIGLDSMSNRLWHIQEMNGITGEGLYEGFDWISEHIKK